MGYVLKGNVQETCDRQIASGGYELGMKQRGPKMNSALAWLWLS